MHALLEETVPNSFWMSHSTSFMNLSTKKKKMDLKILNYKNVIEFNIFMGQTH